jgi:lipoate-protein ligase B
MPGLFFVLPREAINRIFGPGSYMTEFRENKKPYASRFVNLGMIDYDECITMQDSIREHIIQKRESPGTLLFLEHPHIYTHGRLAEDCNLLIDRETIEERGITLRQIDRGGDFTYHGPGQLVAYPIFDLEKLDLNVRQYCHALEEVIIRVLANFGIEAGRHEGYMGTWVGDSKICAVGVGVRKWVTKHGLAFNINTDLSYFEGIIPCGITEYRVTSLRELRGGEQDWDSILALTREAFVSVFNLELTDTTRDELMEDYNAG